MESAVIQNDILVEDFKVGYEVLATATAPNTGHFALNLYGTGGRQHCSSHCRSL